MALWLRQSSSRTVKMGPFIDDTDFKTPETALTISQADIRLSKNGGAFAQTNNSAGATHDASGYYGVPLDTTDTNTTGILRVFIHESGALPVWQDFMVLPDNVFDALTSTSTLLKVNVHEWKDGTVATPTVGGVPEVDLTHWLGTAAATPTTAGVPEVDLTHINGTAAAAVLQAYLAQGGVSGLAQTGTLSSTQMTTDLTEATDDHYKDRSLVWITGALAGMAVTVTAYLGSTKRFTYSTTPTGEAPSNGDRFIVV